MPDHRRDEDDAPPTLQKPLPGEGKDTRSWLAELDRTVTARSRIGLIALAVAIGTAGAATFIAVDAGERSATDEQVQDLRNRVSDLDDAVGRSADAVDGLGAEIDSASADAADAGAAAADLADEVEALQAEIDDLRSTVESIDLGGGEQLPGEGDGVPFNE